MKPPPIPQCPPEASFLPDGHPPSNCDLLCSEDMEDMEQDKVGSNKNFIQNNNLSQLALVEKPRQRVKNLGKRKYVILRTSWPPASLILKQRVLQNQDPSTYWVDNKEILENSQGLNVSSKKLAESICSTSNSEQPFLVPEVTEFAKHVPKLIQPTNVSFVKGSLPNFWECPNCKHLPFKARGKHSVLYKGGGKAPSSDKYPIIQIHLQFCQEAKAKYNSEPMTNKGGWDNSDDDDEQKSLGVRKSRRLGGKKEDYQTDQCALQVLGDKRPNGRASTRKRKKKKTIRKEEGRLGDATKDIPHKSVKEITISPSDTGLFDVDSDLRITASIDVLVISQVVTCSYVRAKDTILFLRQMPLPDGYPGLKCKYCKKYWFFNSYVQLATGLPKIEQHLMNQCKCCPKSIKSEISAAKHQEEMERYILRTKTKDKITRRQYANVVFTRMKAPAL